MKKIAAPPPPLPDNFVAYTPPSTPRVGKISPISPVSQPSVNHVVAANVAIKQMQAGLIDLYNAFKYYPMFNKDPNYREDNSKQYGESYEHGSDSFLSFMMNRYINKPQVQGQVKTKPEEQTNLIKLIESLKVLSNNKNKQGISVPDGVWGPMTSTALKNLYSIASAMLNLMTKLKISSENYTQADLDQLKEEITKVGDQKAAVAITKNIAGVKKLVGDFMHAMNSEQGKYSAYVRQEKPLEAGFGNKAEYDANDKRVFSAASSSSQPLFYMPQDTIGGVGSIPLDVSALLSKENFNNFVSSNHITSDGKDPTRDPAAMDKLLSYVEQKIKTMGETKNEMAAPPKGY